MKLKLLFLLIFQISFGVLFAQKFEKTSKPELLPNIKVYASGKVENVYLKARTLKSKASPTAEFDITYTGFSDEAKVAFEKAAEIWSYLIESPVPIKIDAHWESMESGVLGSSGPPNLFRNFKNAPFKDTWYHPTVANRLAGYDLDPESYDMITTFNKDYSFYLGTDGNCPYNQTDFITIVLHEIAHGLGFSSGAYKEGTKGGISTNPWDHYMVNSGDSLLMDSTLFENPSSDLLSEFTSNEIYFDSPLSNAANGGSPAELYAPSTWNEGSSISHLGEIYNRTDNALMTYSAGTGEVLHDPGSITLGMLAEIGWVYVRFVHKDIKDMESMLNPVTVEAEIYSDSLLYSDSVFMHYSTDHFVTDNKVAMSTTNDTLYKADIPVVASDTVWYYMEAKTTMDRFYYYPSQGVLNPTTIDSTLYFIIGPDNIKPQLIHIQEEEYIFNYEDSLHLSVEADDNMGLDSIYVEYKVNDNTLKTKTFTFENENPYGLPKFKVDIPLNDETLNFKDTIYYKITAVDISSNSNTITQPENGYYKISIQNLLKPKQDTIINFQESDVDLFIQEGLTITQPTGFNSLGLHSPHPYEEGRNYPGDEVEYSAMLKMPVVIRQDSSHIVFDEIVLVEPGTEGTVYGEFEFWDYVVVEGSKDSGKTWHEFEDGYDCTISSTFTSYYNNNAVGVPSMYKSHIISLIDNPEFSVNDTVLIRFRLWSDQAANGWGWAIDNLEIQKALKTTSIRKFNNNDTKLLVYPNPARDYITIKYQSDNVINEMNISIFSLDGKLIYSNSKSINNKSFSEQLNITDIDKGYYILRLTSGNSVITEKLMIQ